LQVGGVLGTSILGSVLTTRVGDTLFSKLTQAGVPSLVAHKLEAASQLVAQGVAPQVNGAPPVLQRAIDAGSQASFMSGLHEAIVVAAVASFCAVFIGLLVRERPDDASVENEELAA
jgi:hypothetical protein